MGYPALTRWQCAPCFNTFEICNPYLVRPEPIVSLFKSRMDEHGCSQWINTFGWIVFLGRFGSITSQDLFFFFLAGNDYCLVLQKQKIIFFFQQKWCWFSCQSQCLAGKIFKPLSETGSVFTDFVPEPSNEYARLLDNLPRNKHGVYWSHVFWEHILIS